MADAVAPPRDAAPGTVRKKPVYTQLWFWVLAGIVLGILIGLVAPGFARQLKILADLFIQLIKVLIAPVIFCTVVVGIASLGNLARAGGLALRALGYFLVATVIALFLGLLAGNLVQPGAGFAGRPTDAQIAAATASVKTGSQESGFGAFLTNELFPTSFLQPFVDNKVLQVLLLAILTACSISFLSTRMRQQAVAAVNGIAKVIFGIIKIVMWAAPLAALGGMAYTVAAFGAGSLVNLLKLMATFYGTCAVFVVVVLGVVAAWSGFNVLKLIRLIKDELLIIVGTSSSETVLPRLLTKLESAGASRQTVGLVIPTGYSFNLDGTCIYLTLGALFIIQAGGEQLGIGGQIALATLMVLTSKGAAGVTGAGLVTLAASLQAFGGEFFTADAIAVGIALIVGIDRMMSEGRALTNAIGNCVATLVIARWNGELDRERLRAVLDDPSLVDDDMELHHGGGDEEAPEPDGRHSAIPEQRSLETADDDGARREPVVRS
jgi:aerobic C4-dicarboxylate transport protein